MAVRCCAHSQSIAEQGETHFSGESMGMLQKTSSSAALLGGESAPGTLAEGPAACGEPSEARWVVTLHMAQLLANNPC